MDNIQETAGSCIDSNPSSQRERPQSPQLELLIKDQKETRVSEGHVNTRFFIISDIHTKVFKPEEVPKAPTAVDVMICCGDLTENSELHEYKSIINMLSKITSSLKLVIAGNHDGTLDNEGFWDMKNWRYKRWPRLKSEKAPKLFGETGEARLLFEKEGFIVLDEGHHSFSLGNGAKLKVYASPATPRRSSRYKAFQYKRPKKEVKNFRIDQDVDIVITHGPPKGIRDPDPIGIKYKGCDSLFDSIARARPRLHCFGHNHGGWGATLVEWKEETGDEQLKVKESVVQHEKELMSLKDIDPAVYGMDEWSQENGKRMKRELAKTRCVPTSHCAGDMLFVQKGKQTLFVNASWSQIDKYGRGEYTQWPWLVDIEIPKQRDNVEPTNSDGAMELHTLVIAQEGTGNSTPKNPPTGDQPSTVDKLTKLVACLDDGEANDAELVSYRQEHIRQQTDQNEHPQGGTRSAPDRKTRQGLYGFQNQNRNMEMGFWRQTPTEAEHKCGDKSGLDAWSTQNSLGKHVVDEKLSPPERYSRPQGHEGLSPPERRSDNKKYGFSKAQNRDTSGPWRHDRGVNEAPGGWRDDSRPSSSRKNHEGKLSDDRGANGNRGVYGFLWDQQPSKLV
ncbi:putative rhamnogalacturonate lyase C [Cytospora mali]|uniref:Rhamnogalacturonate lyase C n=1 Tax=Cytospora mali TaxID=578113 RepID=A0A194V3P9_CYTMA|nr:putative rhamnogalacturonate lyase C [Valsa mali var. pyri (nom. inval.)]